MNNTVMTVSNRSGGVSLILSWLTTPDPLFVMLVVSAIAGTFLLVAGDWLGFRASYQGTQVSTIAAPDFRLTDQFGAQHALSDYRGGPVVLTFLYTNCTDACPTTAEKLRAVSQMLGNDAVGVTWMAVSVDPRGDTVEAAHAFSEQHAPTQGWYYMTGSAAQLAQVWKDYDVSVFNVESNAAGSDADGGLEHSLPIMIIDEGGNERLSYTADFDPAAMTKDLRLLMGANDTVPTVPFGID